LPTALPEPPVRDLAFPAAAAFGMRPFASGTVARTGHDPRLPRRGGQGVGAGLFHRSRACGDARKRRAIAYHARLGKPRPLSG